MKDVRFPDGTVVRASSIADRRQRDESRDFGLYLDPAWEPDWPAIVVDWPDYGLPVSSLVAFGQITEAFDRARSGDRVEIGCLGGLGRTGTVLACMAVLCGVAPAAAIDWVRSDYDQRAIETPEQERWVDWFASHLKRGRGQAMSSFDVVETLSNAFGPSGFEDEVTQIIRELVEPLVDDIQVDPLGNLLVTKRGRSDRKVMIDAHMDEIGFMVSYIEDGGFLRFSTIGGWDARIVPSHRMTVRADDGNDVHGIIGTLPPHLLSAADRSKPHQIEDLFVDIGVESAAEAEALGVRVGSPAVIHYPFQRLQGDMVTGKALDDRGGCAVLIATLEALASEEPELTVVGAFTVREEVGLIGAGTAAYQIEPDLALVLEGTIGADMPGVPKTRQVTRIGSGPAITVADGSQIVKPELVSFLTKIADEAEIPWHYKLPPFGGTDGGIIQRSRGGVRSASVSIPCRYIHSPFSVMRMADFEHTVALTTEFARRADQLLD